MSHLIFSWNIDSVKPEKWNRLAAFIEKERPSVICLNETKSKPDKLEALIASLGDYDHVINSHVPAQYHGVAVLIHKDLEWEKLDVKLSCDARYDNKSSDPTIGRLTAIRLKGVNFKTEEKDGEDIVIVSTYSPNSGIDRYNPLKNLTYRIESWDTALFGLLLSLEATYKNVIWIGDINVAPTEVDVSHPKAFKQHAGFTIEERESFAGFLRDSKWIDVWRHHHPKTLGYTFKGYRSYRYRLRLDNCVVSPSILEKITESTIYPDKDFMESDHNPISIRI